MKSQTLTRQDGAIAVMVAILMFVFIAFAALALDITHITVTKNELQNAADAGALAGAGNLYDDDGAEVNTGANQIAYDTATANMSENAAAEVNWTDGNSGDVQRGHYSFTTESFTANDSTEAIDLWDASTQELDENTDFINAVRVIARRSNTPIQAFFAKIFGYNGFTLSAEAIAYIGFAGSVQKEEIDQPIAMCAQALKNEDGEYSCNIGRMINSGNNSTTSETGGWTDFNQKDDPCNGGANANSVADAVCGGGNQNSIQLGYDIATTNGQVQNAFTDLYDCWVNTTGKTELWNLTLPVMDCPGNSIGTCQEIVGAVNLNIVWINNHNDSGYDNAPTEMDDWIAEYTIDENGQTIWEDGESRWNSFVEHFNLQNMDGSAAPYQQKAIYYLPDCEEHELKGTTGGENFGVLAETPVLVK